MNLSLLEPFSAQLVIKAVAQQTPQWQTMKRFCVFTTHKVRASAILCQWHSQCGLVTTLSMTWQVHALVGAHEEDLTHMEQHVFILLSRGLDAVLPHHSSPLTVSTPGALSHA